MNRFAALALLTLVASSAHATTLLTSCQILAVEDSTLALAAGEQLSVTDDGAVIGSTLYKNATITEQTNGDSQAVRILDRSATIEVISNIRTGEGTLYVTPVGGSTTEVAKLLCM